MNKFIFFPFEIILLCVAVQSSSRAAPDDRPLSVQQLSMGFVSTVNRADPLLLTATPVSVASVKNWSGATSCNRLYGLKELNLSAAAFAGRFGKTVLAASLSRFGFELYKEQKIAIGFATQVFSRLQAGIVVRYQQISIKNYGQAGTVVLDAGWQYSLSSATTITGAFHNIHRATIGKGKQPLPQVLQVGIRYSPVSKICTVAEIYKDVSYTPEVRFGVEANLLASLSLRAGFTRNPARFTGGFGLHFAEFSLDYAFAYHPVLGYTHALGISISR
ncbi:MAG TPA: hypothetical protein ENH29_05740 [Bacteroidetes bacterium]|nr:hypothetical protein [Bacteroidota bacterium]